MDGLKDLVTSCSLTVVASVVSAVIIAAIPVFQIGILFKLLWVPYRSLPNRKTCENTCFDAVFKGTYEAATDRHAYKHVYFNATWQTSRIWFVTVLYMVLGYELLKQLILLKKSRSLRYSMFFLLCANIYSHVYAWWSFFNYYNDDFYDLFNHQVYFAVTEMMSTYALFRLCHKRGGRPLELYGIVVGTSFVHVLIGGIDQFFVQVFSAKTKSFLFWRDLGLLIPDVLTATVSLLDCIVHVRRSRQDVYSVIETNRTTVACFSHKKMLILAMYVVTIFMIGLVL